MADHPLEDEPFSYQALKSGAVIIRAKGKTAKTLRGREADKFLAKIEGLDRLGAQGLMARATGQFKFGNERVGMTHSDHDIQEI